MTALSECSPQESATRRKPHRRSLPLLSIPEVPLSFGAQSHKETGCPLLTSAEVMHQVLSKPSINRRQSKDSLSSSVSRQYTVDSIASTTTVLEYSSPSC